MNKFLIIFLVSVVAVGILIFAWFYLINIYEVKILVSPESLSLNPKSKIEVRVIPLNSFGSEALFRNISAKFKIIKGEELIRIENSSQSSIEIYSQGKVGVAEILVTPAIGLFPSKIEIRIADKNQ